MNDIQNIYETNIKLLSERSGFMEEKAEFLNEIDLENGEAVRVGRHGLEFFLNGQYYRVSSKCLEQEVELLVKNITEKRDYLLVVFSIANLELLHKVMETITADTRILIYEPNAYLLKYVLLHYDLSFLLESNQVGILFDYDAPQNMEQEIISYTSLQWGNLVKNIRIISPPYVYHYMDKCQNVITLLTTAIQVRIKLLGNSLEDIFNGQENNYKNIDAILESSNLEDIKDKFKGFPAIVVASGPSLDKNIDILCKAQDKALIMACDASVEACKKHGVKPDAIASIERDIPTYQYYYEGKEFDEKLVLVGPSVLWPQIYEEYKGKKLVTSKVNTGIEKWWADNFEEFQFLNLGMSSAHVAFAYAKYAGCNPIILIGQDLAYTNNKKHSDLTHTEYEGANDDREADGLVAEDIYGEMVPTDDIYNLFRNWYEIQISCDEELCVVDATEGGAKIQGSKIMTLQEAIDEYCSSKLEFRLYDCLKEVKELSPAAYIQKYEQVIKEAKKQQRRLQKLKTKAEKHYKTLEKLYYEKDIEHMKEEQLVKVLLKMQKGDTIIQDIQKQEYLLTYFQQMIRQTIIFVKGLGNEITPDNVKQNIRFQANLMGVMKNSSEIISGEYQKMIAFLENKILEKTKML